MQPMPSVAMVLSRRNCHGAAPVCEKSTAHRILYLIESSALNCTLNCRERVRCLLPQSCSSDTRAGRTPHLVSTKPVAVLQLD